MRKKPVIIAALVLLGLWHLYVLLPVLLSKEPVRGSLSIQDRYQQSIAELPFPSGFSIPIGEDEEIPEELLQSFLRVEDERFQSHWGIDIIAKLRALKSNFQASGVVSGGSTITEQYLKLRYFPNSPRSWTQKAREATLALYTSLTQSKEEVFRNYANQLYFGNRLYGIKSAMKLYFQKSHLETLTPSEIVTLLAILRSPGVVDSSERYYQERFERIRERLGWTEEQAPLLDKDFEGFRSSDQFPHVSSSIKQFLRSEFDGELAPASGTMTVVTTIDARLQEQSRQKMQESLDILAEHDVGNAAVYVLQPHTGDILVWQGSRDFWDAEHDGQVNVITRPRQVGSAIKPFLYYYAFQQGYQPEQLIVDLEKNYQDALREGQYHPLNYSLRQGGILPLRMALANSYNLSAVRLSEILGLSAWYQELNRLGLSLPNTVEHYGYSLALGSAEWSLQTLADSYGRLAHQEREVDSHLWKSWHFEGSKGQELSAEFSTSSEQLTLDPAKEQALSFLWQSLSDPLNRRDSFGVHSSLSTDPVFAVKTGTTKNFRDNWTFGYRPDLVVATWVGNNDNTPMKDVDGITGAAPIWNRVVTLAKEAGYLRQPDPDIAEGLEWGQKCLDPSCTRQETVLQREGSQWNSIPSQGVFCREEFVDSQLDESELEEIRKLYGFEAIRIQECSQADNSPQESLSTQLILSPADGEVFTLHPDIPLELQEIPLKASEEVNWYLNGVWVGYKKIMYIQPDIGTHTLRAEKENVSEEISLSVQSWQ